MSAGAMTGLGRVAVLMGGLSAEREVSLKSGSMILSALRSLGVDAHAFDPKEHPIAELASGGYSRAFIALHGRHGEDGTMQGALELMGIPYTGSGVLASALAMDKWRTKLVWQAMAVPTARWELLAPGTDTDGVVARLGLPLMVKPASEGSSIGMSKVKTAAELPAARDLALGHDPVSLAESFVTGMELTIGILGDQALPAIRLETPREFYDYEAKYLRNDTRYIVPCGLPADAERVLREEALRAFRALGCSGWGRVDMMLDQSGKPYFLEVNTSPGMTDHSLVPMAARHAGIEFPQLCLRILGSARLHCQEVAHAR